MNEERTGEYLRQVEHIHGHRSLFVLFLLAIVLSVLRFKDSDYTFDIFKLFLTHSKSFLFQVKETVILTLTFIPV
jgi:hypothetical protein